MPDYAEYRRRGRVIAGNRLVVGVVIGAAFLWAMWGTGFSVFSFVRGISNSAEFIASDLMPPRIDGISRFIEPALDTLYMSYVAVGISIVLSIPLGVLAARNTTVHGAVAAVATVTVAFIRAVPSLVLAIFLVAILGLGPLPGTLAMGIGGVGILAKAYADALDAIDMHQVEGIRAAGGTWLQTLGQGAWPQFKPAFVTWSLYRLDLNIRAASVLGLVGAGGLGHSLGTQISLFQYRTATSIILMIFVLILLVETATALLRRRIL